MTDKPITREEKYLAYLTGDYTGELPKPITRKEKYLYELCLKGMGGEVSPEEIKNAVNEYLEKNPVKPGATTEQAQQIEQNKTDIGSLKEETDSLKEDLSNKITKFYASSQGETHLADSDDGNIMDMMLYGKSSQDGTPSPENPVEIKSVVNPTVKLSNEDGTQFKTLTLPYTLNAIPVNSGGNVTIDGQQYIADYVYVERGKLVQKILKWHLSDFRGFRNGNVWHLDTSKLGIVGTELGLSNRFKIQNANYANPKENELYVSKDGKAVSLNMRGMTDDEMKKWISDNNTEVYSTLANPIEIDLTDEKIQAFKALATYYPTTNISVNSEQLDGYTVFNYPISLANGWNYVKQQLNDNRDYIYDMDLQSAEAYVNSEYAVALTELEV